MPQVWTGRSCANPKAARSATPRKVLSDLRVDIAGVMAHGAMPHQGRNPISAASRFIEAGREIEADLQATFGDHPQLGLPYVTPTHVDAGSLAQINVIPASTLLTFDNRTIPGIDHGDLLASFPRRRRRDRS